MSTRMPLNKEQMAILAHTVTRAAGGLYCGDSRAMRELVASGLMQSAGRKSFVPDEYFQITAEGQKALHDSIDPVVK